MQREISFNEQKEKKITWTNINTYLKSDEQNALFFLSLFFCLILNKKKNTYAFANILLKLVEICSINYTM